MQRSYTGIHTLDKRAGRLSATLDQQVSEALGTVKQLLASRHMHQFPSATIDSGQSMHTSVGIYGAQRPVRHPEKAHHPDQSARTKKPDWLRVKAPGSALWEPTHRVVRSRGLTTVCEEASCPNIGECWEKKHATFMILGEVCTRACAFCNVRTGTPNQLPDKTEPERIAGAVEELELTHVVITSVDRDDLEDGGAGHFAQVIRTIRQARPNVTIEVLTPDFRNKKGALEILIEARPDLFNHNIETVPSNYKTVRPGGRYFESLRLLQRAKEIDASVFTKSGLMLGLGEERTEVVQVMDDLRCADVDVLTIGQYLQPTPKHHPVHRFVPPEEFDAYRITASAKGFALVSATPLTRSSHHAGEAFLRLREARRRQLEPSCHGGVLPSV